jgi:predicted ArsR family transcriptional regulator
MPFPLTLEQLRLMSFGPRRDIIALLANDPELSARDMAQRLGRRVTALYRHLDLLLEAGLIRQTGARPGPKRPEALFALASRLYHPSPEIFATADGRAAYVRAAARYAAAASRRFARSVESGEGRMFDADANAALINVDLQLDRAGLIAFNQRLAAFLESVRELRVRAAGDVEQVTLTLLVAPTRAGAG